LFFQAKKIKTILLSKKMSQRPIPKSGILKIDIYVPGRTKAPKGIKTIKLSSNESPLGASEKAIEAYKDIADNLATYPDGSSKNLREALAETYNIKAENIVIGAGSDELLHLLAQTYLGENDKALINEYGFLVYPIVTKGAGATIKTAKANNYKADVDALLKAITPDTKIIFLDNPNNPCGTYLSANELERLHNGMRKDILLVIDSAYAHYVNAKDYNAGIELVEKNENVVMVQTFSKIGLAALRLGWLYGSPHIVDALNRLRGPFNVNMAAQAAGIATLKDKDFIKNLVAHNEKWRAWLTKELASNRLQILPSQGNFILALFPDETGLSAKKADETLLKHGLVTRRVEAYGLPNALRISIGDEQAMQKVAKVLKVFIKENSDV